MQHKSSFVRLGLTDLLLTTAVRHIWLKRLWSRGFWDLEELHSPELQQKVLVQLSLVAYKYKTHK